MNDCLKRIAEGNLGAATVLAMIVKEFPSDAMKWMHRMDELGVYGQAIWDGFRACRQDSQLFLECLENGSLAKGQK